MVGFRKNVKVSQNRDALGTRMCDKLIMEFPFTVSHGLICEITIYTGQKRRDEVLIRAGPESALGHNVTIIPYEPLNKPYITLDSISFPCYVPCVSPCAVTYFGC